MLLVVTVPLVVGAPAAPRAQLIILSNSSPHVTIIDAENNQIVKTGDVLQNAVWTWNQDRSYFDGTHLWLGARNPTTNDAEVVLWNVETLRIDRRIAVGKETGNLFIARRSRAGKLFVAKFNAAQLVVIDIATASVERTVDVPVSGGVACDVDLAVGLDGRERAYVPTFRGNRVVVLDTGTLQVLQNVRFPAGNLPWMVTTTPDGRRAWIQEQAVNSNVIVNVLTLDQLERVPAGTAPATGTFSPDGKVHFTGHFNDAVVTANDTETFAELWRTRVGANTDKLGVHPSGRFVYAIASREGAVAVLEAATGRLVTRINLGTNPSGLFVRRLN